MTPTCRLHLKADIEVAGGSGPVDSLSLSYWRSYCCWGRRMRVIASFTFPSQGWKQEKEGGALRNSCAKEVASKPLAKLERMDGSIDVTVSVERRGKSVFQTSVPLAYLLDVVKRTKAGNHAVLYFSLAGAGTSRDGAEPWPFTALFCNGKRLGETDAESSSPAREINVRGPDEEANPAQETSPGQKKNPNRASPSKQQRYHPPYDHPRNDLQNKDGGPKGCSKSCGSQYTEGLKIHCCPVPVSNMSYEYRPRQRRRNKNPHFEKATTNARRRCKKSMATTTRTITSRSGGRAPPAKRRRHSRWREAIIAYGLCYAPLLAALVLSLLMVWQEQV